ncbi:hypothetical protein Golob_008378 [Gossypium lobatum]|uniref:UBC core domain-containing protein n=1 Tax=Gossypium lobatum TaxID=34289 RepID=A0A7J8MF91_9ROSI|nr:hypothetical protein [Gossypium lobatum]
MSILIFFILSGTFKLTLQFTEDYPNKPPTVRFVSRMFHPNSLCSHCFVIQILIPLQILKLLGCLVRTSANTIGEYVR